MGDQLNYAALVLPIFAAAILVEILVARRRGRLRELYAFGTAMSDVGCGAVFQAAEVLLNLATLALYALLYEHVRVFTFAPQSPWPWVIGLVGVDFLYYWWHRISHVANVMWAVHGVHHQSEDYNLAVALRQPLLEPITLMLFFWVLAVLGVPPIVYIISFGANLFYQFWIHTELVGTLPRPLEWVLNTPSHHRVHHGVDPAYLDKNYAGVLVLWDRLFGTFEPERARPTYGTTIPLRSYNPLWANLEHLHRMWQLCRAAPRITDKLWVWFAHPAWLPHGVSDPATKPDRSHYEKYRPAVARSTIWYVGTSLVVAVLLAVPFVLVGHTLPVIQVATAASVLVVSYVALGALVEGKRWAGPLDWLRIAGLTAAAGWLCAAGWSPTAGLALAVSVLGLSLALRLGLRPQVGVPATAHSHP